MPPPVVTEIGPVVAPVGTVTVIDVGLAAETVATTPLNLTILLAIVELKLVPEMVTVVPTEALAGLNDVIDDDAAGVTPPVPTPPFDEVGLDEPHPDMTHKTTDNIAVRKKATTTLFFFIFSFLCINLMVILSKIIQKSNYIKNVVAKIAQQEKVLKSLYSVLH